MGDILKKLFVGIIFIIGVGLVVKTLFLSSYPDFTVYYYSAQNILHGMNPYIAHPPAKDIFLYPPFALFIFLPFSLCSISIAGKVFTVFSLVCLFLSFLILYKIHNIQFLSKTGLLLMGLTFLSFPVRFTLGMGQINFLILVLIVYFLYYLQHKEKMKSSIFLGLTYAIKLFPFLLLVYLMIKKEWKVIFGTVMVLFITLLLSLGIVSPQVLLHYLLQLPSLSNSWPTAYYNQAISGFISHIGISKGSEVIRLILSGILLLVSFFALFKKKKKQTTNDLSIGYIVTLSLLINPFSWQHHFAFLIIPFISMVIYMQQHKKSMLQYILLFISYILIAINLKNPSSFFGIIQSHVFLGTFLLWIIMTYTVIKQYE